MVEEGQSRTGARLADIGYAAVALIAISNLVFGWAMRSQPFIRIDRDFAAMVPSTAILFIVSSLGLLAFSHLRRSSTRKLILIVSATFIALVALADLVILATTPSSGIDEFLWPGVLERPGDGMAVGTATSFAIAAACGFTLLSNRDGARMAFAVLSTLGLVLSSVALVGYALDSEALFAVFVFTAMALHTAFAFAILFAAMMLIAPDRGWIWLLFGNEYGSRGARLLMPLMILGPFVLSLAVLIATDAGIFNANFRLSLLAIIMILIASTAVLRNASIQNRAEAERRRITDDLSTALADRSLLLREVYHRVKNNLQQINALLSIERGKIDDPAARKSFDVMSGRVHALGMVHQLLIQSSQPSRVNVEEFLDELLDSIESGHGLEGRNIAITRDARTDEVNLEVAMTLGLLVNELVSNAIEHAFDGQESGRIEVLYDEPREGRRRLTVRDDGNGIAAEELSGTGSIIIRSLVSQLEGEMSVEQLRGTAVSITFPADLSEKTQYA